MLNPLSQMAYVWDAMIATIEVGSALPSNLFKNVNNKMVILFKINISMVFRKFLMLLATRASKY